MSHYLWALRPYYRQVAGQLLLGSLAGVVMNTAVVLPAICLGRAIDAATLYARGGLGRQALVQSILLFIAATLATELPRAGKRWWLMTANARIRANLRADALRGVMAWPMATLAGASAGDLMARIVGDVEVLGIGVREVIVETWDTLLFLLSFLVAMLLLDRPLTLLALLPVPLAMLLAWVSGRWVRRRTTAARQASSALTAGLHEALSAIRVVRLLGARQTLASRIGQLAGEQARTTLAATLPRTALPAVYTTLMTAGVALVLWLGGEKVVAGAWTIGAFVTYLDLFLRFTGRGFRVPQMINSIQAAGSAYARVQPLLAAPVPASGTPRFASFRAARLSAPVADPSLAASAAPATDKIGGLSVSLRDVSFAHGHHDAAAALALDHVSLEIAAGAFVAVTGPVGSGKSALVKALLGLYPLAGGTVTLDGDPPARHRERMAYLPQETFLFSGTVRDNVVMGGHATAAATANALEIAALAQDLAGMAKGADTEIGEQGIRVSGGQRQRIALARAVATTPRLLLLDDPFSAVDGHTEASIGAALREAFGPGAPVAQRATVVLCSHRLSAFPHADLVVVLDKGRIVEQGTHAALLQSGGLYARIHAAQSTIAVGEGA